MTVIDLTDPRTENTTLLRVTGPEEETAGTMVSSRMLIDCDGVSRLMDVRSLIAESKPVLFYRDEEL